MYIYGFELGADRHVIYWVIQHHCSEIQGIGNCSGSGFQITVTYKVLSIHHLITYHLPSWMSSQKASQIWSVAC